MAEVSCKDEDAVLRWKATNKGELWPYRAAQKYPPEEKELAVLAKYWCPLKELVQGQAGDQGRHLESGTQVP